MNSEPGPPKKDGWKEAAERYGVQIAALESLLKEEQARTQRGEERIRILEREIASCNGPVHGRTAWEGFALPPSKLAVTISAVRHLMERLQKTDPAGFTLSQIEAEAEKEGIKRVNVAPAFAQLKRLYEIYECRSGTWKLLK